MRSVPPNLDEFGNPIPDYNEHLTTDLVPEDTISGDAWRHILRLSDHEYLGTRLSRYYGGHRFEFVRFNTRSNTITPLTGLTDRLGKLFDAGYIGENVIKTVNFEARMSPNGKWLMILGFHIVIIDPSAKDSVREEPSPFGVNFTVNIDGERIVTLSSNMGKQPSGTYIPVTWLSDSRRWVELWSDKMVMHDMKRPDWAHELPLPKAMHRTLYHSMRGLVEVEGIPELAPTQNDHAILAEIVQESPIIYDFDLNNDRVKQIHGPYESYGGLWKGSLSATISPNGRKIAWTFQRHWYMSGPPPVGPEITAWVTNLDGSGRIEIGKRYAPDNSYEPLVAWKPDSKHVSWYGQTVTVK